MPFSPSDIESLLRLGAAGLLLAFMSLCIHLLWKMVKELQQQIVEERDKREELIRESVKSSTVVLDGLSRLVESVNRLEQKR